MLTMTEGFLENFQKDLEVIYARYSTSFDGSAELLLSEWELPDNVKILQNSSFSKCGKWQVLEKRQSPPPPNSIVVLNSSYSSDENNFLSYHRDEGSGRILMTPTHLLDEESTSSSSCDSDDMHDENCSGLIRAKSKAIKRRSKKKHEPSQIISSTVLPHNCPQRKGLSDKDDSENGCNGAWGKVHKQAVREITSLSNKVNLFNVDHSPVNKIGKLSTCSDLLDAVSEFRKFLTDTLTKSRQHSEKPLALVSRTCVSDNHFKASVEGCHGGNFFKDQRNELKNSENACNKKRLGSAEPGCVVEKLFVRHKGSRGNDLIEVASRQSLAGENEINNLHCSVSNRDERSQLSNQVQSPNNFISRMNQSSAPSLALISNSGVPSPLHSTPVKRSRVLSAGDNSPRSLHPGVWPVVDGVILSPKMKRFGASFRSFSIRNQGSFDEFNKCMPFKTKPLLNFGEKLLHCKTPWTVRRDKAVESPGPRNNVTERRSVPLRATPGSKSLRLSDISPDVYQASTPDKRTLHSSISKHLIRTSNSDDGFRPIRIPQPRRTSEAIQPGSLTRGNLVPSGIRSPSISPGDCSREHNNLTAANNCETVSRGSSGKSVSRRCLYSSPEQSSKPCQSRAVLHWYEGAKQIKNSAPLEFDENCTKTTKTPTGEKLKESHSYPFDQLNTSTFPKDDSRRGMSLKLKTTPRRKSSGFHPYMNTVERKSPSLSTPLKALSILSPSSASKEPVRWTTLENNPGRNSRKKHPENSPLSRKSLVAACSGAFKKCKHPEKTDGDDATQDCCRGYCTKKFCFNCSMDCS